MSLAWVDQRAREVLRAYPSKIVARGRVYAEEGRVRDLAVDERGITAVVQGSEPYRVDLAAGGTGQSCVCPAFAREAACKHIAALAWTVTRGGATRQNARKAVPAASPRPKAAQRSVASSAVPDHDAVLPPIFATVYSASAFVERLAIYRGESLGVDIEPYVPLSSWWRHAHPSPRVSELRNHVIDLAPEIERSLETLRRWRPGPSPLPPGSGFSAVYGELVRIYEAHSSNVRVGALVPGPFDARHPGFEISYFAKRRVFELRERSSRLLTGGSSLAIVVGLDTPGQPVTFQGSAFAEYGPVDSWELFALRAMIMALETRDSSAVLDLERDLTRPLWEHLLERLVGKQSTPAREREWSFCLSQSGRSSFSISAFARPLTTSKPGRWKRERFEGVFDDDVLPIEREIARLALVGDRSGGGGATFVLGTPHGHELLRHLAGHPRVFLGSRHARFDPDEGVPVEICAGQLTMSLERQRTGALAPRFLVDGSPVVMPDEPLTGDRSSAFRAGTSVRALLSLEIPAPLRSWLDMALRFGDALAFPVEATPKLVTATQSLMAAGIVDLPRAALGDELPYDPRAALRVEWATSEEGLEVVLEVMIQVAPNAPFIAAGSGPKLFTFEEDGRRVFVERTLSRELTVAGEAVDRIDGEIDWLEGVGRIKNIAAALAFAGWLEENPLRFPIEVKAGRTPTVRMLGDDRKGKLAVRKIGAWLRLDGALELGGAKVSLGELLEAARHARRYVRVGDGSFLELSKEVISKLTPVAVAAALVPKADPSAISAFGEGGVLMHDAFGSIVTELAAVFEGVEAKGFDLGDYVRRFDARDRCLRIPKLTNGTLRDYQRDGVEWMLRLAAWAPGCVLADDMGLGKTVQTAAVLGVRAKLGPALVVAPASVSSNWVAELARFMPGLVVRWYNEDRTTAFGDLGPGDVLVVSYNLLQIRSKEFRERHWSTLVLDEAQYVKNIAAQRRDAVGRLSRDFTIALTGTPLENHLGELFSIVDLVFPGLLGDADTFRDCFRRPIEAHREGERLAMLGTLLGPFLLRRTRASVLRELPPRQDITEYVELSLPERKRYLALRKVCEQSISRRKGEETPAQLRIAMLAALTRLRQMACDVRLVEPSFPSPSTKVARTVELARQLADEGNCVLVFSQFSQFLDKVRVALVEEGLRVAMLTGETPTTSRRPLIDAFQAGDFDVFCVSLLAGGTGLNLTKASYVIHLDPWWNPAAEEQATSRAYRMGQVKPVTVYRLVARGTIEEAVLEMHADKRELAAAVLEGKGSPKAITSNDLLDLLRFGA